MAGRPDRAVVREHGLEIDHIGFHVSDLDQAVDHWVSAYGAGPFYAFPDLEFEVLTFRGEPFSWRHSAAYGRLGTLGIELQTFAFPTPLPDLEVIVAPGGNLHNHTCFDTADIDRASARLEKRGFPLFLVGANGEDRFHWHDARDELGHCIELHTASPILDRFRRAMVRATATWDGSDPLRAVPPEWWTTTADPGPIESIESIETRTPAKSRPPTPHPERGHAN